MGDAADDYYDSAMRQQDNAEPPDGEPMICCMCGEDVEDGRPIIYREDGEVRCGFLSDCYRRSHIREVSSGTIDPVEGEDK